MQKNFMAGIIRLGRHCYYQKATVGGLGRIFSDLIDAVFCKEEIGCQKSLTVASCLGRFFLLPRWSTRHSVTIRVAIQCL
jgi:hypothetical protein